MPRSSFETREDFLLWLTNGDTARARWLAIQLDNYRRTKFGAA